MSDMKPKGAPFALNGKTYRLRMTLNVIDDIQSHYGISIAELPDLLNDAARQISAVKFLIAAMVNEDIACSNDETGAKTAPVDERYVGRYLDIRDSSALAAIYAAVGTSMPATEDDDGEGDDPNVTSA